MRLYFVIGLRTNKLERLYSVNLFSQINIDPNLGWTTNLEILDSAEKPRQEQTLDLFLSRMSIMRKKFNKDVLEQYSKQDHQWI